MSTLVAGALFGLSIALPFGPVSLMCVQRSLYLGLRPGLISAAGAASTHGVYATIAVLGADAVAGTLTRWHLTIRFASAAILILMGIRSVLRSPVLHQPINAHADAAANFMTGLTMAMTNPMTVLAYAAFASSTVLLGAGVAPASAVVGVVAGTSAWYATLSGSAWVLRGRLPQRALSKLNVVAGVGLIVMGLLMTLR